MRIFRFAVLVCLGAMLMGNSVLEAAVRFEASDDCHRTPSAPEREPQPIGIRTRADLLAKARAANDHLYSTLQSFVCREAIHRYRSDLRGRTGHTVDTVTANLSFESGVEQYSKIRQNTHAIDGISSIQGAWSVGEFGTLLRQTEELLNTQEGVFEAYTNSDGAEAAVYRFTTRSAGSPWELLVEGRRYYLAFQTEVWISTMSGEILKIARKSLSIPPETGISAIAWNVKLLSVELNNKKWLLPSTGTYTVYYDQANRRDWNQLNFMDYHRYAAEASLRFDDVK